MGFIQVTYLVVSTFLIFIMALWLHRLMSRTPMNFLGQDLNVLSSMPQQEWTRANELRGIIQQRFVVISETGVAAHDISLGHIFWSLHRLEQAGLVTGRWTDEVPRQGLRRREYRPVVRVEKIT